MSVVIPYVRPGARVLLRADAEPAAVDERRGERADPVTLVRPELEVLGGARPEAGQQLAEPDELVVLRLLLGRAEVRVVEVLATPGRVDPGRLQPRGRGWARSRRPARRAG